MKKIIVFVKQVPNNDKIELDWEKGVLKREKANAILNPADYFAVKEALRLKEEEKCLLTAISMGPLNAQEILRYLLALGFDNAFLVSDTVFAGSDTWATAKILSRAVEYLGFADLYFFGKESSDGDTGQVPQQFAAFLDIPCFSYVENISFMENTIEITCDWEEKIVFTSSFPLCCSFKNSPSSHSFLFPSAKNFFEEQKISVITNKELEIENNCIGLKGSPTQVIRVNTPELGKRKKEIIIWNKESLEKITNFVKIFKGERE